MNYSLLSLIAGDKVSLVSCVFTLYDSDRFSTTNKTYTFKTILKDLKKDDLVVVECAGHSNQFGFNIVKVVSVNNLADFDNKIDYKWIVSKLDTKELDVIKEAEESLIKEIKEIQLNEKKAQLIEAMKLGSGTQKFDIFQKFENNLSQRAITGRTSVTETEIVEAPYEEIMSAHFK